MANAKLSVKINKALLLLIEQKKIPYILFIYSLLKNHVSAKIFIPGKGFGGG